MAAARASEAGRRQGLLGQVHQGLGEGGLLPEGPLHPDPLGDLVQDQNPHLPQAAPPDAVGPPPEAHLRAPPSRAGARVAGRSPSPTSASTPRISRARVLAKPRSPKRTTTPSGSSSSTSESRFLSAARARERAVLSR